MVTPNQLAEVAAAIGEPARSAMLAALMDGRALTARELAQVAAITPQTASGHLARLTAVHLVTVERQGRHRYHRLASPDVAEMIEGLMRIAGGDAPPRRPLRVGPRDTALRQARTCYDHLAGGLGVGIWDGLIASGIVEAEGDGCRVSASGRNLLAQIGIPLPRPEAARSSRPVCHPCLDWSERRPHLAGQLGAAICAHAFDQAWVRRIPGSRALDITPKGRLALFQAFGVRMER